MSHFYDPKTGEPKHFVTTKDGSKLRPSTIADCKKNGWYPGVTTVLNCISKPGLERWKTTQNLLAVLTAPDVPGEGIDAKVERVLSSGQQDEEAAKARTLGSDLHAGMEALFSGGRCDEELRPWIEPAYLEVKKLCPITVYTEFVLVGDGYAGKSDLIAAVGAYGANNYIVDFKTCKKLPDKAWPEARLQLAAYAKAWQMKMTCAGDPNTMSVYISTVDAGKFAIFINPPWQKDYEEGFAPLVKHWRWANGF